MRYKSKTDIGHLHEKSTVASLAIRFANSKDESENATDSWMVAQYETLKVLPPRTPYFLDDCGRVYARRKGEVLSNRQVWINASPAAVERWWKILRQVLSTVAKDPNVFPDQIVKRPKSGKVLNKTISVTFPKEGWSRTFINGISIDVTSQSFVAPTIDVFVAYAAILLSRKPWRSRVSKCVKCDKYFLNPIGKRGRRRKVCSDKCADDRGDPTVWERQQRYRDARRKEKAKSLEGI